ncbi:MAG: hypothetical protein WA989_08840 [Henriciella sp.]|uniref:hypothetical protein n=1 Tax=Henriciella sp. TaxID=1968823 RepID=UPI003C76C752
MKTLIAVLLVQSLAAAASANPRSCFKYDAFPSFGELSLMEIGESAVAGHYYIEFHGPIIFSGTFRGVQTEFGWRVESCEDGEPGRSSPQQVDIIKFADGRVKLHGMRLERVDCDEITLSDRIRSG